MPLSSCGLLLDSWAAFAQTQEYKIARGLRSSQQGLERTLQNSPFPRRKDFDVQYLIGVHTVMLNLFIVVELFGKKYRWNPLNSSLFTLQISDTFSPSSSSEIKETYLNIFVMASSLFKMQLKEFSGLISRRI